MDEIRQLSAYVPISTEQLADAVRMRALLTTPGRYEAGERARLAAEADARRAAELSAAQDRHAAVHAQLDGKLGKVADLHGPRMPSLWVVCEGCEFDGYESEPPAWPCATWTTIADGLE